MSEPQTITLPVPSTLTRPYWDAAREGRLVLPHCNSCGKFFFRPEIVCKHCGSRDWAYERSAGRGTLYSFSVVHRAPTKAYKVPFVLAIVELEEGVCLFSNVVGIEPDQVRIGMPLRVDFQPVTEEITLPVFRPA